MGTTRSFGPSLNSPETRPVSPLLDQIVDYELQTDSPEILEAFRLLGLVWEDD